MAYILACGHQVAHQDQPHYCDYLRLNELLHLQPAAEQLRHPDEHLFIIVHQSSEIWFKQILFELRRCIAALDADNVGLAIWLVRRINRIAALLPATLQLLDTMSPSDFFTFRPCISPASGAEGQQFREIELVIGVRDSAYRERLEETTVTDGAPACLWTERLNTLWNSRSLRAALQDLFERRNLTPEHIYVVTPQTNPNSDIFLLVEELLDFDENMMLWRSMHVRIAERAIGPVLSGTGRSAGVSYLEAASATRRFFPNLWELRTSLWEGRGYSAHPSPDESRRSCPASPSKAMSGEKS